ncbi:MAG: hypothetical protein HYV16_08015 [Gammaproteobacteria bacterium]|nr:hypothetical protein [Gammaproteobacteria bacterium]
MPTPLENFIAEAMQSPKTFCLDGRRLAVGTDKAGFSPLLEGVKWVSSVSANVEDLGTEWVMLPLCFSYHLVLTKASWSEEGNLSWIKSTVTGGDAPNLCHVFHDKAAEALDNGSGKCSLERFRSDYRGQRNATFKELEIILAAGYTKVTDVGRPGHAILWR